MLSNNCNLNDYLIFFSFQNCIYVLSTNPSNNLLSFLLVSAVISSFVLLNNTVIVFESTVIGSGIKWSHFDNTITNNSDITNTIQMSMIFFLSYPYVCLWLLSPCQTISILFYFIPSRQNNSNWAFHQFKMPPTTR